MMTLQDLLRSAMDMGGSDLHIKAGSPPLARVNGILVPVETESLTPDEASEISVSGLSEQHKERFHAEQELNFALTLSDDTRWRGNLYVQRGITQGVFRFIPPQIPTLEELRLPPVCKYFAERPRGLVLVTGPTGSGRSTTQAAMIDYINRHLPRHILTIEDPIEFVHQGQLALINQLELHQDAHSYPAALRAALRQDTDVLLVSEIRDAETARLALTAAATGHLVIGTLDTPDASQSVEHLIDMFPGQQQQSVRTQLSHILVGVVAQVLVRTADGRGRAAAFETLVGLPNVRSLIRENKSHQINALIQTGMRQGMATRDQSLASLVKKGMVTYEEAHRHARNLTEFHFLCTDGVVTPAVLPVPRPPSA